MKDFPGTPGTRTALFLRVSQFLFAAGSIIWMATTCNFVNYTAFCYLIASMGLQGVWSLGLACLDAYSLTRKKLFHNLLLVSLFAVGDWVTALLSLAAASASAGIIILNFMAHGDCQTDHLKHLMSISLAFICWVSIEISSLIMLWLLALG